LDQFLPLLFAGRDPYRSGPLHGDCLEAFRTENASDPTGRMRKTVHNHRQAHQVFACLADCSHLRLRTHLLAYRIGGVVYAIAPKVRPIPDLDFVIDDCYIDRLLRLPFDDYVVPAGVFDFGTPTAPHVPGRDQLVRVNNRENGRDGGPAAAGRARAGQRSHSQDNLVIHVEGFGTRRHLIPEDLVSGTRAAQDVFIPGNRVFDMDRSRCQIHTQSFSRPSTESAQCEATSSKKYRGVRAE